VEQNTLPNEHLAYIAGFFDGEGCVRINKTLSSNKKLRSNPAYSLTCSVSNTNPFVLEYLCDCFGGSVHLLNRGNEKRRPIWEWRIYGNAASSFLCQIVSFLKLKDKEAKIAITFQQYKSQLPRGRGKFHLSTIVDEVYQILKSAKREVF